MLLVELKELGRISSNFDFECNFPFVARMDVCSSILIKSPFMCLMCALNCLNVYKLLCIQNKCSLKQFESAMLVA